MISLYGVLSSESVWSTWRMRLGTWMNVCSVGAVCVRESVSSLAPFFTTGHCRIRLGPSSLFSRVMWRLSDLSEDSGWFTAPAEWLFSLGRLHSSYRRYAWPPCLITVLWQMVTAHQTHSAPIDQNQLIIAIYLYIYYLFVLVLLYGCETWSLILRLDCGLKIFANRIQRQTFVTKRNENEE